MLQKFQNIFRVEISPFIRLADRNSGIIHFEKVDTGDVIHDKNNNSGNSGNASIRDEVDVNTAEGNRNRQLHSTNIEIFDTKNSLRTVNIEKPETSNSANWTGFLIEKGYCDLHKLGTEFLAININDSRSRSTCSVSHRFVKNKIPRTSYKKNLKLNVSDDVCADHINVMNSKCDHDDNNENNGKLISSSNKASIRFEVENTAHDLQSLFHPDLDKLNLIFNFAMQICSCVAVLHDLGYVWLDLKPANFVIFVKNNITEKEFESKNISVNENKIGNENENITINENGNGNGKREEEFHNYSHINVNKHITTTEILNNKDNDKQEKYIRNFSEIFSYNCGFSFVIKAIDLGGCSVVNTTHDLCALTFTAKFMAPELAQLIILKNDDTSDMKHVSTNIAHDVDEGNEDRSEGNHKCKIDNNANHDVDNDYHHHNDNNVTKTDPSDPRQRIEYTVSTAYDSWSLGICLLQLFHKDFKCFFSDMKKESKYVEEIKDENENENDGDKRCSHRSKNSDLVLQKLADFGHLLQSEINEYLSKFVCIEDTSAKNWNNSDADNNVRNDNYHCGDRNAMCCDDHDDDDNDKKCGINSSGNKCNTLNECPDNYNLLNNQKTGKSNLDHMDIEEKNAQKFKKNVLNVIRKLLRVNPSERISVKEAHSMMTSSNLFIQ